MLPATVAVGFTRGGLTVNTNLDNMKKPNKINCPKEDMEATMFADYLRARGIMFGHIKNENTINNFAYIAKMKRLGVNRGVPDYIIVHKGKIIFIEMKRVKGSKVSPEQEQWIKALNDAGCYARICYGHIDAESFVEAI